MIAGLEQPAYVDLIGYLFGGGGTVVVLAGLRRVPRLLRWIDEHAVTVGEILRAFETKTLRESRIALKQEALLDHQLLELGIDPPEASGKVERRSAAVQRVADGHPSGIISLVPEGDTEASYTDARKVARDLAIASMELDRALDARERARAKGQAQDVPKPRGRGWSSRHRKAR